MSSLNDPLLFIQGPPVFHLPPEFKEVIEFEKLVQDGEEESTSIYEKNREMSGTTSAILDKLYFLAKPFQRQVYRPLTFHLKGGGILQGEVEEVNGKSVTIKLNSGENAIYSIEQVLKIAWRGSIMK